MKKNYIAPESKLITISVSENIAISGGVSEVGGAAIITFTEGFDGCRELYTDLIGVQTTGTNFIDYYDELQRLVGETGNYKAWFDCFKRK
ncbi:MAG: hypothetical protein IJZ57_05790 [Clostridia bacterium]|nr:hypothetical protein [Clostridia bacterium]